MHEDTERHPGRGADRGANRAEPAELYRTVRLIRRTEERLKDLFAAGEVPGFIHLSIGQEAISAGVMSALTPQDTIASTHRGHGHAIAKGLSLPGFFAELLGKEDGLCRGRGGSMHVADMSVGMLGANGIVAAGLSIAMGSALAHKTLKREAIAAVFFGDGALAEGVVHETFNLAKLWRLPLLFVCENNGWGEFLPTSKQISFKLADLAAAYGLPHDDVDGNNVFAVAESAHRAVGRIRAGEGPRILECRTTRVRGHYEGDAQKYRAPDEIKALAERDAVQLAALALTKQGSSEAELSAINDEVERTLDTAVEKARTGAEAAFETARREVYTREARS